MKTMFIDAVGDRRRELVKALGNALNAQPLYLGMPTRAYQVRGRLVDFAGNVEGELSAETLHFLAERGFNAMPQGDKTAATAFDSDAKEIQYYIKQILADGKPYTAKELKSLIAERAGRSFSAGAYAGAFRELVGNDCRYIADGRGVYRFANFDGDADLLPFASILTNAKNKMLYTRHKSLIGNQQTSDKVSRAIEILDTLIAELLSV
jgi:phage FluMu protein gp41